jgi:hypothetical protein
MSCGLFGMRRSRLLTLSVGLRAKTAIERARSRRASMGLTTLREEGVALAAIRRTSWASRDSRWPSRHTGDPAISRRTGLGSA